MELADESNELVEGEADVEPEDGTGEVVVPGEWALDLLDFGYGYLIGNAVALYYTDGGL